jgi:hypothetical protein
LTGSTDTIFGKEPTNFLNIDKIYKVKFDFEESDFSNDVMNEVFA